MTLEEIKTMTKEEKQKQLEWSDEHEFGTIYAKCLLKEKQELIDYLKEKKKEYIELYNKSCDIIDFDRYESLNILCEEILSKIEKD